MNAVKTVMLVDGANSYMTAIQLQLRIDYILLKKYMEGLFGEMQAYYYTAIYEDNSGYQKLRTLVDALSYNGYRIVEKQAKEYEEEKVKGNMDVEIAVDAIDIATYAQHVILVTGDGDFTYLVKNLQRRGLMITCVSTKDMASYDLRRTVDRFVDLKDIRKHIEQKEKSDGTGPDERSSATQRGRFQLP